MPAASATHIQYVAQDHRMPGYLSVPETRQEGEKWYHPLGRELLRGGLKALGHTIAGFADANPIATEKKG